MSASSLSTFLAAASVVARLVPTGSSCLTVSVSWSHWSKKFVFSSGGQADGDQEDHDGDEHAGQPARGWRTAATGT